MIQGSKRLGNAYPWVEFLEWLGFRFELDFDDELLVEARSILAAEDIMQAIRDRNDEVVAVIRHRAERSRCQLIGGPFNGQAHGRWVGDVVPMPIKRGCWAVYRVSRDGRAFFKGYATSKAKARKMEALTANRPGFKE